MPRINGIPAMPSLPGCALSTCEATRRASNLLISDRKAPVWETRDGF
jgi:hypothetical protein